MPVDVSKVLQDGMLTGMGTAAGANPTDNALHAVFASDVLEAGLIVRQNSFPDSMGPDVTDAGVG